MTPPRPQPSASVIAAAIVAILAGVLAAIFISFAFFTALRLSISRPDLNFPAALRPIIYGAWVFFLLGAIFLVIVGVNVLRLRNWARVAILLAAALALLFGLVGIGAILLMLYLPQTDPSFSKPLLASILACIYGAPVIVGTWWLILFTRRPIADQFPASSRSDKSAPSSASLSIFNNPLCPLPIRIVAWYLASFIFVVPFLPFLPSHFFPALYFGHLFVGPQALLVHFFSYSLMTAAGFGLLLLKRWGYSLAVASQSLLLLAGLFTAFSPSLEIQMRTAFAVMNLPEPVFAHAEALTRNMRYFMLLGLLLPIAFLVLLFLFRRPFLAASGAASTSATPSS